MKLVNFNFKKVIALLICLMLSFDIYVCFERRHRLHKSHKFNRHHRIHKSHKNKGTTREDFTLETKNPWIKFTIGVMEGIMGNETTWLTCLLPKYFPGVEETETSKAVDTNIEKVHWAWTNVVETFKVIVDKICSIASILVNVKNLNEVLFTKQFNLRRRVFLEGKFVRKAKRAGHFADVLATARQYGTWLKDSAIQIGNDIKDTAKEVFDSQIKPALNSIIGYLDPFKELMLTYYKSPSMGWINKVLTCVVSGGSAALNIARVIIGTLTKVALIATGVGIFAILVQHLWGLLCNWELFLNAVGFAKEAVTAHELYNKTYFWGKAVGTLFHAFATADSLGKTRRFKKLK